MRSIRVIRKPYFNFYIFVWNKIHFNGKRPHGFLMRMRVLAYVPRELLQAVTNSCRKVDMRQAFVAAFFQFNGLYLGCIRITKLKEGT